MEQSARAWCPIRHDLSPSDLPKAPYQKPVVTKFGWVYKTFVGEYMTSLEMEGFSVSLLRLDDELKALLDAHADTIAFKA